ncbi:hypothetical protein RFI_02117 [Reticulomyxa filosa]|uniref:SAM domain-containing protein n=1 Tax=Reticulomyxa filosa TaxID=46433 RepID=X6PBC8_RETFI|nr:hypothetical protein RFI_02117 [Reticulomyxa filosa]|eukprot:ETO34957.1 hypothetical protein RFI_02117 [Reticulomyxa filosa]
MHDFEVEIAQRPLGVKFAHADHGETVVMHMVLEDSVGAKLGLQPGDVLIRLNGKTLLNKTSAEALKEFRNHPLPYKVTFRRFDDEDENENENEKNKENSESEQTMFIREEVNHLMAGLQVNPHHKSNKVTFHKKKKKKSVQLKEWSAQDVLAWLTNYGRTLGTPQRFEKYHELFLENKIDGKVLRGLDRIDLAKIGVTDDDAHDLFIGIRELNNVVQVSMDDILANAKHAAKNSANVSTNISVEIDDEPLQDESQEREEVDASQQDPQDQDEIKQDDNYEVIEYYFS